MNGPKPRIVVFDLDDTLLDHRHAERAALADLHGSYADHIGHYELSHVQDVYHEVNVPLWRDFGRGKITATDLKRLRSIRLLNALNVRGVEPEAFSAAYLAQYGQHWRWMEGAESAFHEVSDTLPVGLLTNGFSAQQRGKLARFPTLEERSQFVVISEEAGAMKPSAAIFEHTTAEASRVLGSDVRPDEVLYVGDSFHSDVEGGTAYGWRVAWYNGDPERAPEGVVTFSDWRVLIEALGS